MPTAIITGAAGGIGGALVAGFRAAGYTVTAVDLAGVEVALDVCDLAAVKKFAAGVESVDVLLNAAGIIRRGGAEHDPEVFAEVLAVNLTGTMNLTAALKPALARAKGSVINFASVYATFGAPHAPGYAASKGGVVQLTKSLAVAWAKEGIRVNAIAPGWIVTEMSSPARGDPVRSAQVMARTPMGRWGLPEDLVGPALFLASAAAGFVTGITLPVDGGYVVT